MGQFPHLLQYTSESLALWLQMLVDGRPSYGLGSLALLGRGLEGWLGYLSVVGLSLGLAGIRMGFVCSHDASGPAPWMIVGQSVGE